LFPGFRDEFERLWRVLAEHKCEALTLGNYAGYDNGRFVVERLPDVSASIRTHGLGACLAFPVNEFLLGWSANPPASSWDTDASRVVARGRVLTSEASWIAHEGRDSGMCAGNGHRGLDFSNVKPDRNLKGGDIPPEYRDKGDLGRCTRT